MREDSWTDEQNDLIVADYFAMLEDDLAGRRYIKAEHNRALQDRLGRGRTAIEYKHQNISAILQWLGQPWIPGYKPAQHVQGALIDAVVGRLDSRAKCPFTEHISDLNADLEAPAELFVGPPPTLMNSPPPKALDYMVSVAREFDAAGRDERNRILGRAGEAYALKHEKAVLTAAGRCDLADQVKWMSEEEGDGAGYDIESFSARGKSRLIEVKTTNGWERTPFYMTRNELAVADRNPDEWCLLRLWNFVREPRAFELSPPLNSHVNLIATSFEARFH